MGKKRTKEQNERFNAKRRESCRLYRLTHPRKYRITADMLTADGFVICSKCAGGYPSSHYQRGHGGWCRKCRSELETQRRRAKGIKPAKRSIIVDGEKLCMRCMKMQPLLRFAPSKRGLGGVISYCRYCRSKMFKTKARIYTANWRERHRERHLSQHRLYMFKRKTMIDVTNDGTVTDDVLKSIYSQLTCFYCYTETPIKQRTADHMIPLVKGGSHSAKNLVMACRTCNCSKGDMTADQFQLFRNKK